MSVARLIVPACLGLLSCTVPEGRHVSAAALPSDAGAAPAATPIASAPAEGFAAALEEAAPDRATPSSKERDAFDDRALELQRRREDHERAVAAFNDRLARTGREHETKRAAERQAIAEAERALRFAREDLQRFEEIERPRRLALAEVELEASFHRLLEQREEMAQLEIMYGESDLGDATAEIVLSRTRRRLELAERRHGLAEQRRDMVRDLELPREHEELVGKVADAEAELMLVQRRAEDAELARAAAQRELEDERLELARELEDVERGLERYARDVDAWQRGLAEGAGA